MKHTEDVATDIVAALFVDLRDRSLLKWLFSERETTVCPHVESIAPYVQDEIADTWRRIVRQRLAKHPRRKREAQR